MKTPLLAIMCLLCASLHAESFTNVTKGGAIVVTTITLPARKRPVIPSPPMPPGLHASLPAPKPRKPSPMAGTVVVKQQKALVLTDLIRTNRSNVVTIVGKLPPATMKRPAKRFSPAGLSPLTVPPITEPPGPPVVITSQVNQPVYFPNGEIVLSHIVNVKAVQLAGFDCRIDYTSDFVTFGTSGDFGQSPTDRTVEVNLIIPMDQDWPEVFWQGVNYHR